MKTAMPTREQWQSHTPAACTSNINSYVLVLLLCEHTVHALTSVSEHTVHAFTELVPLPVNGQSRLCEQLGCHIFPQ